MADQLPTPLSRAEAARQHLTTYWNGEPCPQGHKGARYTLNGNCVQCQREWTRADRDRVRDQLGGRRG